MNYQQICNQAIEIIKNTAQYIIEQSESFDNKKVETKGLHNFVSFVDKTSEKKLIDGLKPFIRSLNGLLIHLMEQPILYMG